MSQFDFSNYDPTKRSAFFDLPLETGGSLELLHSGQSNRPYANALAKASAKAQAPRAGDDTGALAMLDNSLELDRKLFPQFVIVGWSGIKNKAGKAVELSPATCAEFLRALPDWIVQRISSFASRPTNFCAPDEPTDADYVAKAGN